MGLFAIIKGNVVDGIAIADAPITTDGEWIDITNLETRPAPGWVYVNGEFSIPPAPPPVEIVTPKTQEEKLSDAIAAAISKLIADGVLKQ